MSYRWRSYFVGAKSIRDGILIVGLCNLGTLIAPSDKGDNFPWLAGILPAFPKLTHPLHISHSPAPFPNPLRLMEWLFSDRYLNIWEIWQLSSHRFLCSEIFKSDDIHAIPTGRITCSSGDRQQRAVSSLPVCPSVQAIVKIMQDLL